MKYLVAVLTWFAVWIGSPLVMAQDASQPNPIDTEAYLRDFHNDPKRVMNRPLVKLDEQGHVVSQAETPFAGERISREELLQARRKIRDQICQASGRSCEPKMRMRSDTFAAYNEANQITAFLYEPTFLRRLLDMENAGLVQTTLQKAPWSDSFWPTRKGMLGRRWRDPGFPNSNNWFDNYTYYTLFPPITLNPEAMSPSEKYDLLVGDYAFTLTDANWREGKGSYDKRGTVPGWAGLCHGWSPASIMTNNPEREITVHSVTGQEITFYPSDIKALASLAWGEAPPRMNFVGSRCDKNNPREDAVGRVLDEGCFDVNPGTWHMAIVNQLGVDKRSFVFDATYDFQVWNYPIYAYQYSYFNPQTLATSKKLAGALVPVNQYTIDKFKTYRSPDARYVVGIAMDVTYSIPVQPSSKPYSTSSFHTVKYVYDLELDANGMIIGGEWYSNFHPDFIWNPPPDGHPLSTGEKTLPAPITWDGVSPLPEELQRAARASSAKNQPLAAVVEALVRLASPSASAPPAPTPTPGPAPGPAPALVSELPR